MFGKSLCLMVSCKYVFSIRIFKDRSANGILFDFSSNELRLEKIFMRINKIIKNNTECLQE